MFNWVLWSMFGCIQYSKILWNCFRACSVQYCPVFQVIHLPILWWDACQPKVHDPRAAKTDEIPFMHVLRVVRNIHSPLHVVFRSGTRRDGARFSPKHPSMAAAAVLLCTAAEAKCSAGWGGLQPLSICISKCVWNLFVCLHTIVFLSNCSVGASGCRGRWSRRRRERRRGRRSRRRRRRRSCCGLQPRSRCDPAPPQLCHFVFVFVFVFVICCCSILLESTASTALAPVEPSYTSTAPRNAPASHLQRPLNLFKCAWISSNLFQSL